MQEDLRFPRAEANYSPNYTRFLIHSKNYVQQYNQLYLKRLSQMKNRIRTQVANVWGETIPVLPQIIDVESDAYRTQDCVLIGMTYKDLKLRGSVIKDSKDSKNKGFIQPLANLASDKDSLILEDHSGRIILSGEFLKHIPELVTGIVLAVKGSLNEFGEFMVNDWLFSYNLTDIPDDQSAIVSSQADKYILLVSGLNVGSENPEIHDLSFQLLIDFINGKVNDEKSLSIARKITRVIIAGNSLAQVENTPLKEKLTTQKSSSLSANPSKQFDLSLAQILTSCQVDILPGFKDPANISLPQQPLHPCLFPQSARFNSLERVTNPTEFSLDNVRILGHDGRPIDDIARQTYPSSQKIVRSSNSETIAEAGACSLAPNLMNLQEEIDQPEQNDTLTMDIEEEVVDVDPKPKKIISNLNDISNRLQILKNTLAWGHLCPTAPDTTPTYPFSEIEPFIITEDNIPDILFCGNQPGYASELVLLQDGSHEKKVRLICLPKFKETGIAVLCNLASPDLTCTTLCFK